VFYIRKGLDEHLDLEPTVTIGVLCDSVGPGPGVEEQEQEQEQDEGSVERLRTLVLGFLSERMKKILLIMKDEAGSEPERILVEGVVRVSRFFFLSFFIVDYLLMVVGDSKIWD
jgi:hypothetical protein